MKSWSVKRNTSGGLVIQTIMLDGRHVASYPTIPKWYYKPLWPWALIQSIKAIKLVERTHGTV